MSSKNNASAVSAREAKNLFADFENVPALVLAVSGGPDSTALLVLAARWRDGLKKNAPKLLAVTVDHGLRAESKREAAAVKKLSSKLRVPHRVVRWRGKKPSSGLPQAARVARYALLAEAAKNSGAAHILTAHTLDDQAETVLIRLTRGSGLTGLGAMARVTRLDTLMLVRPFLGIPKARLIATLRAARIPYADDPTNIDPRFTRARLRAGMMQNLEREGLSAARLSILAQRLRRADAAIETAVTQAAGELFLDPPSDACVMLDASGFFQQPAEIALRLLGRAIVQVGDEGPVELGKLEALADAAHRHASANTRFRRTLAGAIVTIENGRVRVERAPARRSRLLTKRRRGKPAQAKAR